MEAMRFLWVLQIILSVDASVDLVEEKQWRSWAWLDFLRMSWDLALQMGVLEMEARRYSLRISASFEKRPVIDES